MEERKLEELQKCIESPYYFFTNHLMMNNERFHTFLTEEEFNLVFNSYLENKDKIILKSRNGNK